MKCRVEKESAEATKIPFSSEILKGKWGGTVYAITSESETLEEHNAAVDECVGRIKSDFDDRNHWSVSLREVKRELVYADEHLRQWCTLVQFRVRDSY